MIRALEKELENQYRRRDLSETYPWLENLANVLATREHAILAFFLVTHLSEFLSPVVYRDLFAQLWNADLRVLQRIQQVFLNGNYSLKDVQRMLLSVFASIYATWNQY
jgi:hypothetical protein